MEDKNKTNNFYIIVGILLGLLIIFLYYKKQESFEEEENTKELDEIEILEQCKDMTADKLFKLFNEDLNYLTQIFIDNNIPSSAIKNLSYYPKIASLLVKKGILKCS